MTAVEGVPITIATGENLTIMTVIYKVGCFREIFMLPVNFEPFFQSLLAHRLIFNQRQPPEVFYKKGVLRNFAKFTGKHLCQRVFFNGLQLYQKRLSGTIVFLWILPNF